VTRGQKPAGRTCPVALPRREPNPQRRRGIQYGMLIGSCSTPATISRCACILCLTVLAFGCNRATPTPDPHYVLGKPYQAGGVWHYPKEAFDLDETGLAVIAKDSPKPLTANGEIADQTALAAAHPTIQLPAIAQLTTLQNGREVTIRLNDRGSGDPHRLLEITKRTALLLAIPAAGVAQVRLQVLPNESHAAADALPGAPTLALTAAPRGRVEVAELTPPPGIRQGRAQPVLIAPVARPPQAPSVAPPLRLPEAVIQGIPRPGQLMVQLNTFDEYQFADVQRARMAAAGARIVATVDGRTRRYRVEVGPLPDVARADTVLERALASGIPDARIVVK
jgi:rare lipoprotein A